jgi:hypothetical protein
VLTLLDLFHQVIFMEAVPLCHVLLHWISLFETVGFAGQKTLNLPSGNSTTKPLTREIR